MPPKLKTEIVERSMFIFLPNRLLLLLNSSIPSKTFFSQRAFFSTLLGGGPEASCAIDHGDNHFEQYRDDSGEVRSS